MKIKPLVLAKYPNAVCVRTVAAKFAGGEFGVFSDVYGLGRQLGQAKSAKGAWLDAYEEHVK